MAESQKLEKAKSLRNDLMVLTKVRLNVFVLITTLFGYLLASRFYSNVWIVDFWVLFHTLLGTTAAAFASATFNQLMEVEEDRKMKRTENRPLPSSRIPAGSAFLLGWVLAGFGVVHLANMANAAAAMLASATLLIYVFVYTPMKRKSSMNTLVGAIPGALPPMIGWAAVSGDSHWWAIPSWFLFALLFFWQLPHFVAINWICREDYESAGYAMWSNGDVSGKKTAKLAFSFSLCLVGLTLAAGIFGMLLPGTSNAEAWFPGMGGTLASFQMCRLSLAFGKQGTRESARTLFLYTLLYLPILLTLLAIDWM
jgi:heme o synthase